MTPGEALRAWRDREGMSQRDFAARLGLEQYEISRIESGKVEPRASVAEGIRLLTGGEVTWPPSAGVDPSPTGTDDDRS
jgi:transcriptional regulator with XRE-family HTH domain